MPTYRSKDLLLVPNLLSAARVPLAVAFPLVFPDRPMALFVLGAAAASDVLDGWLARRWNQATPLGALVDGVSDKIFAASVLGTLVGHHVLSPLLAVLLATRELGELPLALRMLSTKKARRRIELERKANAFGKITTGLEFAAVVAAIVGAPHLAALVGVTSAMGAVAAVTYWTREIRAMRAKRAGGAAYAR
jgi:phosphatidylglycerophosphate synthase